MWPVDGIQLQSCSTVLNHSGNSGDAESDFCSQVIDCLYHFHFIIPFWQQALQHTSLCSKKDFQKRLSGVALRENLPSTGVSCLHDASNKMLGELLAVYVVNRKYKKSAAEWTL